MTDQNTSATPFDSNGEKWHILVTRSRAEKKVFETLQKFGIQVYLPLKSERKKWSDRWKVVETPLFPGYLFVQFDESKRFTILNSQGSVCFLRFEGKDAVLSRRDVQMLEIALSDTHDLEVVDTNLYAGQIVQITSGPFKNFTAKLVHQNGKGKLLLEVAAIAQGVLLEIGNARIVPVNEVNSGE